MNLGYTPTLSLILSYPLIYIIIVIACLKKKTLMELRGFTVEPVAFLWAAPTRI